MGLARDLTMGNGGRGRRSSTQPGSTPVYRLLRTLTAAPELTAEQLAELRAACEQVAAGGRLRPAEIRIWAAACTRYKQETGEKIGPDTQYT